jgi:hypothetical protein
VVLFIEEGLHVPVIPFGEVVLRVGGVVPLHSVRVVAKSGVIGLETVTANVVEEAH